MKRQFLILIVLSISLVAGCGTRASATPTADHLVEFDNQGIGVLRGYIVRGTSTPDNSESISMDIPVKMDSMDAAINIPFRVIPETIVSSTIMKQTDVLEYLSFHHGAAVSEAFPTNALVEVTFRGTSTGFVAISIHEVEEGFRLFDNTPKIDPVFAMENFAAGTLSGRITQSIQQNDGTVLWRVAMPIMMQGNEVFEVVWVQSAPDTEVISTSGNIVMVKDVTGDVQINFTRSRNVLTAHQVTIITP